MRLPTKRLIRHIKLGTINKYTTEHGTKYHLRHFKELSTAGRDTESIYWLHAENIFFECFSHWSDSMILVRIIDLFHFTRAVDPIHKSSLKKAWSIWTKTYVAWPYKGHTTTLPSTAHTWLLGKCRTLWGTMSKQYTAVIQLRHYQWSIRSQHTDCGCSWTRFVILLKCFTA